MGGHHVTCVISVNKLDNVSSWYVGPTSPAGQLASFRLEVLFPRPGNIISGCISCSKNSSNSSSANVKSPSEYRCENIEYGKKTLQNTLLIPSLRDGNAIETFLMTAQINTDFVNHPVPSTTEPLTSLVRVGTDACESIVNSIVRYKDFDFHKNAWPR
ncbi:uncharacterized protein TNCV_4228041 [Trichonephila clavipes]|nr:uncharacterized protein TNCV_4228041 [Trichonephila clavipes]